MTERTFFTKADCVSFEPVEAYSIEKQKDRFTTVATTIEDARNVILEAPRWLPVAAESYNISPNIKDYVLVPVIAIVSDLPNRNGHAFSRKTLASWTMDRKQVMAHTFTGCPTHVEHQNQDPTKAKGIILSSILKSMPGAQGDLIKNVQLLAFDRNRDPALANAILSGERKSYSMGALTRDYRTTCCGALATKGGCEHLQNPNGGKIVRLKDGRLGYWQTVDPSGFECSSVKVGAYTSATNPKYINMSEV